MKKELTKTQFETLKGVSDFLSITEIARYRKVKHPSVSRTIRILLDKGSVEKIGRKYVITERGRKRLHSLIGSKYNLRQHNLHIKAKILESRQNWDKKRNQLIQLPYFNKRVELKNNYYDLFNYGKFQIKTTSKSIIFKLPTIYSKTINSAVLQAMDIFFRSIPKVEVLFKVKLIKDNKCNIEIISQEYARIDDALAKIYRRQANKLYIHDDEGKIWLIADYSFNNDELETIQPTNAEEDMVTVHNFMNDLRDHPIKLSEVMENLKETNESLKKSSRSQLMTSQVLEQMNKNIIELTKIVGKMKNDKM